MTVEKQWEDLLTPAVLQERLVTASLYITAYEMLKESIMGRLKDFYCIGFTSDGLTTSPAYERKVLALNKSALYASLSWLKDSQVIDAGDIELFEQLKLLRNSLAHELPEIVLTGKDVKLTSRMQEVMSLLQKIEVWWVLNVEIGTNPDFDGREINPDEITPGPVLIMQIMLEVLSGNETLKEHYKNAGSTA